MHPLNLLSILLLFADAVMMVNKECPPSPCWRPIHHLKGIFARNFGAGIFHVNPRFHTTIDVGCTLGLTWKIPTLHIELSARISGERVRSLVVHQHELLLVKGHRFRCLLAYIKA